MLPSTTMQRPQAGTSMRLGREASRCQCPCVFISRAADSMAMHRQVLALSAHAVTTAAAITGVAEASSVPIHQPPPSTRHSKRASKQTPPQGQLSLRASAASSSGRAQPAREWEGLKKWRARGVDRSRWWGQAGPTAHQAAPHDVQYADVPLASSLVEVAVQVLQMPCPYGKAALTHRAWVAYHAGKLPLHPLHEESTLHAAKYHSAVTDRAHQQPEQRHVAAVLPSRPGRPDKPQLVAPKQVPSFERGQSPMTSLSAHLLHNLAHIELNAIDLAMDTIARWAGLRLPDAFYEDFARVADDEGRHLSWCLQRLEELGHFYGDMPAHDLLWEGCAASATDLTARLAVVPMSQEARGLDAGQRLTARMVGAGDKRTAAIVARIADEEHAHVAVGVAWFHRVCQALDVPAAPLFRQHLTALAPDLLKGPFHHHARQKVGLDRALYDVSLWPAEAASLITPPAVAAAQRGQREPLTTTDSPNTSDHRLEDRDMSHRSSHGQVAVARAWIPPCPVERQPDNPQQEQHCIDNPCTSAPTCDMGSDTMTSGTKGVLTQTEQHHFHELQLLKERLLTMLQHEGTAHSVTDDAR